MKCSHCRTTTLQSHCFFSNPDAGFEQKRRLSNWLPTLLNLSANHTMSTTISNNYSICSLAYRLTELCPAFPGPELNFLMTECTFVRER